MGQLAPYLLGRRGPGAYLGTSGGGGGGGGSSGGGGFEEEPIATVNTGGDVTIKGKVKPGSFGKFVFPLANIAADRMYTFRYTPSFSQLSQQGKLAMVGFGLKNNNDFHIVGLRGDGSTGLKRYKVHGTPPNGWNKQTGHTEVDGGAPTNGTQAGPNYIRLITSVSGTTITLQTSGDAGTTWITEFSAAVPTPFTNVSGVTTFGIALWFNNADTGPFSIVIEQFADAASSQNQSITIAKNAGDSASSNFNDVSHTFDSEDIDTSGVHSTLSATERLTIPASLNGRYGIIHGFISLSGAAASSSTALYILQNGLSPHGVGMTLGNQGSNTAIFVYVESQPMLLVTGDYYELHMLVTDNTTVRESETSALSLYVVG